MADQILTLFRSVSIIPVIGCALMALWLAKLSLSELASGSPAGTTLAGAGALCFGAVGAVCLRNARRDTLHHLVVPPTSISASFRFTGDQADMFEKRHHTYTMQNESFAQAFVNANRHLIWSNQDEAHAALKRRIAYVILGVCAGAGVLYGIYDDWVH